LFARVLAAIAMAAEFAGADAGLDQVEAAEAAAGFDTEVAATLHFRDPSVACVDEARVAGAAVPARGVVVADDGEVRIVRAEDRVDAIVPGAGIVGVVEVTVVDDRGRAFGLDQVQDRIAVAVGALVADECDEQVRDGRATARASTGCAACGRAAGAAGAAAAAGAACGRATAAARADAAAAAADAIGRVGDAEFRPVTRGAVFAGGEVEAVAVAGVGNQDSSIEHAVDPTLNEGNARGIESEGASPAPGDGPEARPAIRQREGARGAPRD
jgi:hypothetical protein